MEENLKRLQKDIKKLDSYRVITTDELSSFLNDVANVLAQYRSATAAVNTETRDTLNLIVKRVQEEHDRIVEETSNENQTHKKEMYDCLSQMESILEKALSLNYTNGKDGADGKDGQDGKDADEEKIVEEVLKKIVVPEVDLEPLKEDIDSKFSKVYDHIKKSINGFPGVRLLASLMDVSLSSPSNGQALIYNSTTGKWENSTVSGSGDVVGPGSATDNAIARYDGTTGKLIQNSGATIDDSGNITANNLSGTNTGDQSLFRTIAVSGQSDVVADSTTDTLTLVAGSNITITTNAGTDTITIASTGGGSGIVRSISSISSPTTAGATAATDYVYFVSGTTTLTLPTAVGNTNRYTVKNTGSNVVTIDTTSSQTIDGALTYTLNVPYAVDIVSDGSGWFII
jgi:hypothetical protein